MQVAFENHQLYIFGEKRLVRDILRSPSKHPSVTPAVFRMRLFDGLSPEKALAEPFSPPEPSDGKGPSQYRGVHWNTERGRWQAVIRANTKLIMLGRFTLEKLAAHAYDIGAMRYHGVDAKLNFS